MPESRPQGHTEAVWVRQIEQKDVSVRAVLLCAVAMGVIALVLHFGLWGLMKLYHAEPANVPQRVTPLAAAPPPVAAPPLQPDPQSDLHAVRAEEQAQIDGYGWVDRQAGIVRIPVDRAMDLLLQRGVPGGVNSPAPAPARGKSAKPPIITGAGGVPRAAVGETPLPPKPAGLKQLDTQTFPREP